jgi:DNA-binding protein H-NS
MTRDELAKLRDDIDKQMQWLEQQEIKKAREAAESAVASMGFSLDDVFGASGKKKTRGSGKTKSAGTPKYANPENPSQTWTGKGRQPKWFKEAVEAGRSPESMEI